jgi:hypothetical protein
MATAHCEPPLLSPLDSYGDEIFCTFKNFLYKITVLQNTEYKLRIVEHG